MPIYEYECTNCGHTLEIIQKISDEPLKECPSCHEQQLRKLVSAAAFQLKGTGWYATDFKNKPKPKEDSKKAPETADTKSTEKKDTKAEPATTASGDTGASPGKKTTSATD